jgi:hypothetical protein
VYRVAQIIPPDMDAPEGPVLPTDEWVEDTVLTSASGWIEVAKACLVRLVISASPYILCRPFYAFGC